MKLSNLTILSFGGGQDSTAILLLLLFNAEFRRKYAADKLIVVMSDTGNEHPYTYEHLNTVRTLCHQFNVEFHFITADMGFHTAAWQSLKAPQMRESGSKFKETMVQLGTKSCTDKLKIQPIYKFVDEYINDWMGYGFNIQKTRGCNKKAIKKFHEEQGKIRVLIGFAKGEERRAEKSDKIQARDYASEKDVWSKALYREYPLIDVEMDRHACQEYITSKIGYCPMPSNCMLCPYQSDQELIWLAKNHESEWNDWTAIEERKMMRDREAGVEKNHGVYNTKMTLTEKLEKALEKYGDWSMEQLEEYKMSHGCQSNAM